MSKNLPIPKNEVARLDALAQYNILDTLPEEEFDRLTQLASIIFGVPTVLITLIDKDRQWFKSKIGLDAPETPRDISFCQYTINGESLFEIEDATKDERFLSNASVTDQPNIRFYAGYPLIDPDGYALGSLCLIDREARKLTADQRQCLTLLANEVVSQIVSRKKNAEKDKLEKLFNLSIDMICVMGNDGYLKKINPAFAITLGWTIEELLAKPFINFLHPDDITRTINQIEKLKRGEKSIEFENRYITKNGDYVTISWTAAPDEITGERYVIARDITERKKAEELLAEYKHFFYNTANLSCIANVQGYFEVINPNFEKILGYTERELLENQFMSFIHPDDIDLTLKEIEKLQSGVKTINFENRYRKKDGNYLQLDWNATPNPVNGKIYAIARDITERKKAERLMAQIEERNRLIMDSSLNAIINMNIDGIITFWNKRAEIMFGWSNKEAIGSLLSKLIIPHHHREAHSKGMEHYLKTGDGPVLNAQIEITALNKAGDEFPIEIAIIPIEENGELFFSSFIQDISERKKAEFLRKVLQEKYQNIIANMNLGLLEVDNNEIIQYANQSFSAISGYEISELLGKNPSELFVFGENIAIVNAKIQLRQQCKSDSYQIQVKNKRGELRWWAISGAPNYDDNGNLLGAIGIHLDITDQKQLEIDLENEKTKAQEASKAKEFFLANMSHEIRTPLNAIIGFLRELEKQGLSGLQKTYIENSSIASKHLLAILDNILDLSKIEAGEMSLEVEDFLIEDTVNNVLKVLNLKAEQKEIRLTSFISDKVNKVFKGDSLRLEQILFNLIGNALKFTQKGKIEVKCEVLSDSHISQEIQISVADTGIGMEQKFAESIFSKFSQEDKSITRKYGGTGLGMAITKELVLLMGGEIKIESEKNIGTTIHIRINLIKGNTENAKKLQTEVGFKLKGLSILLVEDNEMNRMVVQNTLHYFNCKVTEAENGLEAVKILKTQNFDLILMDIQMPEMDGIEATKVIRKELKLSTPIIALTANAFKTEIEKCKQAGMNDYVTKPFEEAVLLEAIVKHTRSKNGNPSLDNEMNPNQPLYNLNVLRDSSRSSDEFVLKMVGIFVEQTKETIQKIDAALESNNFLEISRLIHKIRPSVDNMGILSIQSDMKALEKIAKETQNKGQITAIYTLVKKTLQLVISQLQKNE